MHTFSNWAGFISLFFYVATRYPSFLRGILCGFRKNCAIVWTTKRRRATGLASFAFALAHVIAVFVEYDINIMDGYSHQTYATGMSIMILMTALALTSNDWSMNKLGYKRWKFIQSSTDLILFGLAVHVAATITVPPPVSAVLSSILVAIAVVASFWRGWNESDMGPKER